MRVNRQLVLFSLLVSVFILPFHVRAHADAHSPNTGACQVCKSNVLPVDVPVVSLLFHASYADIAIPHRMLVLVWDILPSVSPRSPPC